jgi:uncharacterized protein (TIGR01777 family)
VLARAFHRDGHSVVVLSRKPKSAPWPVSQWDGQTLGPWVQHLEGADAVINLAGRSVNCRYGEENRRRIIDSRVDSTRVVGQAIAKATQPPRVWLQASTATIYEHRFDAPNDEFTGILGGSEPNAPDTWRFSIEVATAWQKAAQDALPRPRTRLVLMRSAIIMSPDHGGAFDMLLKLVRLGLGGQNGSGRQFVSWIHETDFIRAVYWLIDRESLSAAVNLAAPNPLPNADFMRGLRQAWRMPIGLPSTEWMLEIGAFVLRTETELVLKSRNVVPRRLLQDGFSFRFPTWLEAARDLCSQWRRRPSAIGPRRTMVSASFGQAPLIPSTFYRHTYQ